MRLIDADNLIPIMKYATIDNEIGVFPIRIGFDAIREVIDEAPTIDAVEVVRCRDCKYGEKRIEDYRCWMLDEDWDIRFSPMHFCSYGRRREDGEA